jgi:PKD repeat protein
MAARLIAWNSSSLRFAPRRPGSRKDASAGLRSIGRNFYKYLQYTYWHPVFLGFWERPNQQVRLSRATINFVSSPFSNDTTYQITLKAYNGCDTTVWIDSVRIRANPRARFGLDTTFGCSPFRVRINNTSPGGASRYYWDFGNGVRDTTFNTGTFDFTYNTGNVVDTITIRLIAENECARDTQAINIRVAPNIIRPLINVSSSQLSGCASHTVTFNNNTSGATGFRWNFGDNSPVMITNSSQATILHTYDVPGVYTVSIDITNGCSDTTVFREITVYPRPAAAFTTNASIYCAGDTVKVNNGSTERNKFSVVLG